jgi:hypothetical protein
MVLFSADFNYGTSHAVHPYDCKVRNLASLFLKKRFRHKASKIEGKWPSIGKQQGITHSGKD